MNRTVLLYLPDTVKAQLLGHVLESKGLVVRLAGHLPDFQDGFASGKYQIGVLDLPTAEDKSEGRGLAALAASNPLGRLAIYTRVAEPRLLGYEHSEIPKNVAYIKDQDTGSLSSLLEAIGAAENKAVPDRLRQHLFGKTPLSHLSNAQMHVLRCIAHGKSNSEIAVLRNTTVRAVENLNKRTMHALGIMTESMSAAKIKASRVYFEATGAILPNGLMPKE